MILLRLKPIVPRMPQPGRSSVREGDDVFVLGHLQGRLNVYISPGKLEARGSLISLANQRNQARFEQILASMNVGDRVLFKEELHSPRLDSNTNTVGGKLRVVGSRFRRICNSCGGRQFFRTEPRARLSRAFGTGRQPFESGQSHSQV